MSDHSISIVPRQSAYLHKEDKAKEILNWLISLDIVKPVLSDCILSSDPGYAISEGATLVTVEPGHLPFHLNTNGLDIITERRVFHTGENGIEKLVCPNCAQDISSEAWDFLSEWSDNTSDTITCPLCNAGSAIHGFDFTPQWGFSDLGFTFWNWPELTADFIHDFKAKLNCDINLVHTWI